MAIAAASSVELKSRKIGPGDKVRWNGYEGRVAKVNGESAVVIEHNNRLFGRTVKWRLRLSALSRV
jgi:FKBP-type peptidyl-prolyl cis-trans isomerase 2